MTHSFIVENSNKIKRCMAFLETKIKIRINIIGNKVTISGSEFNEFLTEKIIRAIDFGFEKEDAILLKDENYVIEHLDIKEHTNRKNLEEVRGRVIGTKGKAKKTIESLTNSIIVINQNEIGIIVHVDFLDATIQSLTSLIRGAKHSNIFSYLERQNTNRKKDNLEDLGLKESVKRLSKDLIKD